MKVKKIILLLLFCLFFTGCKDKLVLEDIPVQCKNFNIEAYVCEGLDDNVDVILNGQRDVLNSISSNDYKVVVVLNKNHKVDKKKQYSYVFMSKVKGDYTYKINPSKTEVILKEKVSNVIEIEPRVRNLDKLDSKLGIKSILFDKKKIIVRGSEKQLKNIKFVYADIDLNDLKITGTGIYNLNNVLIRALDSDMNELKNIEIVSNNINVTIEIIEGDNTYENKISKTVPVTLELVGELSNGSAISNVLLDGISYDQYQVKIEGKTYGLEPMVSVRLDVEGLDLNQKTKEMKVALDKSGNYEIIRDNKSIESINIKLEIDEAKQKVFTNIPISVVNVPSNMQVSILESSNSVSDLQIIGTQNNLVNISENDISLYIDLNDYKAGTYVVPVLSKCNNPMIRLVPNKRNIQVVISNK